MSAPIYLINQQWRITGTFTDPNNEDAPIDPNTVVFKVRQPDGKIFTYTYAASPQTSIKRDSTGVYYFDLLFILPGQWFFRWEGSGSIDSADEQSVMVALSAFY